jgi:hypothetical protein
MALHLLRDVIAVPRGVFCDVFGPQYRGTVAWREMFRVEVGIRADLGNLLVGDTGR